MSLGMEWGIVVLAIGGTLVVLWAAAYFQGRNKERARQSERALTLQQGVEDAVAASRLDRDHFVIDVDGVVRRVPRAAPGVSGEHRPNP